TTGKYMKLANINFLAESISNFKNNFTANQANQMPITRDTIAIILPPNPYIVGNRLTGISNNLLARVKPALILSLFVVGNNLKPAFLYSSSNIHPIAQQCGNCHTNCIANKIMAI